MEKQIHNNCYFDIVDIRIAGLQKIYRIRWKKYFPAGFLKEFSNLANGLGWKRSGQYMVKRKDDDLVVEVAGSILNDFTEALIFLFRTYKPKQVH